MWNCLNFEVWFEMLWLTLHNVRTLQSWITNKDKIDHVEIVNHIGMVKRPWFELSSKCGITGCCPSIAYITSPSDPLLAFQPKVDKSQKYQPHWWFAQRKDWSARSSETTSLKSLSSGISRSVAHTDRRSLVKEWRVGTWRRTATSTMKRPFNEPTWDTYANTTSNKRVFVNKPTMKRL